MLKAVWVFRITFCSFILCECMHIACLVGDTLWDGSWFSPYTMCVLVDSLKQSDSGADSFTC